MSTKKTGSPLEEFKLFYEEIAATKPWQNRIRRVRIANANNQS